ncbi:Clp protease [Salinibacterium sp. NG22]|uniref:Clp protease N-terminal domain-containing protein n=1 Tax=Salinibacterium sp. NG22 TaxID=2792040 RepID=UPI0018CE715C|nr:Clp protease N-terminal domain-containing protein [Salinibacterium sp. NG22]MBH0109941.1 Clp protease [Salinibacterium sp. NG22]
MFEKLAQSARTVVEDARHEAARRGDRRLGTDHLLLALLHEEELAQAVGVDAATAAEAAQQLDRDALTAIGVDLGSFNPTAHAAASKRVPLTAGAKATLQHTLVSAATEKARTVTSRHILLALLDRREPDSAAVLLTALAVDRAAVRESLAASR